MYKLLGYNLKLLYLNNNQKLVTFDNAYRKILNELSGPPDQRSESVKDEPSGGSKSSESSESESASQGITSMQPPTAISYQTGSGTSKFFSIFKK